MTTIANIGFIIKEFPLGGVERDVIDIGNWLSEHGYGIYVLCGFYVPEAYPANKKQLFNIVEFGTTLTEDNAVETVTNTVKQKHLDIDLIACHYNIKPELIQNLKQQLRCKFIYTQHNMPFWETRAKLQREKDKKGIINWLKFHLIVKLSNNSVFHNYHSRYIRNYKSIYNVSDAYTCLCHEYKDILESTLSIDSARSKIRVINNPELSSSDFPLANRSNTILYSGRLSKHDKRVDRLLRIWRLTQEELPDWEIVIAGDGEERANLELQSSELGLKRISFLGWVNNITELMQKSSILCMTSDCEGWGLVLTEAQANGLPAIAFDCSAGVREILSPNGTNGILIPYGDEKEYACQLINLAKSPERRMEIAQNAFRSVKRFSIDESGRRWVELINELIERR